MSSTIGILSIFGLEKLVFSREQGAGYYGLPSYFLSKITVEMPFMILFPWLGGTIVYWMTGLAKTASQYFIAMCFIVLSSLCGFSLGIFFASSVSDLPTALAIAPLCLLPMMVMVAG